MKQVTTFLAVEAAAFGMAALVHGGVLADGYQHREATIAESVIAAGLLVGLVVAVTAPRWSRTAALAAQGFALFFTLVGIFTIIIGIGPQSGFDVALHTGFVVLLAAGLTMAARWTAPMSRLRA